jgi:hypothetical protein
MTRAARTALIVWAAITLLIASSLLWIYLRQGEDGLWVYIQQPPLINLPVTLASVALVWLSAGALLLMIRSGRIDRSNILGIGGFFLVSWVYLNILSERFRYGDYTYYFDAAVKLYNIKVYGEFKLRMRYDNADALAMFRYCGQIGLPVLFHLQCSPMVLKGMAQDIYTWIEWYGGDMTAVETMCRECPDTNFIGHAPGFWREISGDADIDENDYPNGKVTPGGRLVEALRKYPNLYCDLSAGSGANSLNRDLEHAKKFVEEFQDRILFGRDYFDRQQMDVLEKLSLSETVLDKIYYQNSERLIANAGKNI